MPASLDASLSSIASGLDDTVPSFMDEDVPIRPTPPSTTKSSAPQQTDEMEEEKWWDWLAHKLEGFEEWVKHVGQDGDKDEDKDKEGR